MVRAALPLPMLRRATPRFRDDDTPSVVPLPPPAQPAWTPMQEVAAIVRSVALEPTLRAASLKIQREVCRLTRAAEALVVVIDWVRWEIWTMSGRVTNEATQLLVAEVARTGRRSVLGHALLEPMGTTPASVVLALRRPTGHDFLPHEVALISALGAGFGPVLERVLPPPTSRP